LPEDLEKIRAARKSRLDLAERPDLGELASGHVQPPRTEALPASST
jgi:hypothetical protein